MLHNWPIINLKKTDSTNNYAHLLINNNELMDEAVIVAEEQLYGRGQEGNSWESEPGKNLTFTVVLFTHYLEAEKQFFLAKAVSLAVLDFLKNYNITAKIKWPNDIYAENKKIAGILIENSILAKNLLYSLIGIGLNVNQQKFSSNLTNVESMKNITLKDYDLNSLLNELLFFLKARVEKLKKLDFFSLREDYIESLYKFNIKSRFYANGKSFWGTIKDVESDGHLVILSEEDLMLKFMFKEVRFL